RRDPDPALPLAHRDGARLRPGLDRHRRQHLPEGFVAALTRVFAAAIVLAGCARAAAPASPSTVPLPPAFPSATPAAAAHRPHGGDRLLRSEHLPQGAVLSTIYSDTTYSTVANYDGSADSAEWTGTALAAQAWRYRATGAPDAAREMTALAATLHRALNVS